MSIYHQFELSVQYIFTSSPSAEYERFEIDDAAKENQMSTQKTIERNIKNFFMKFI